MYEVKPIINKEFILAKVSQQEIFEFYLPGVKITTNKSIKSPLRNDNHPTCTFKYTSNGKLLMRDWAGYFFGDCFELVSTIYGNCGYIAALHYIAKDMQLADVDIPTNIEVQRKSLNSIQLESHNKSEVRIRVKTKAWSKDDVERWTKYGWTKELVELYKIYPVEFVWTVRQGEEKLVYSFHKEDPAYAYWFAPEEYKIYFPERSIYRFMSNSTCVQGLQQLAESGDVLIITKSLKDVGPIVRCGFNAVAPQAESILFSQDTIDMLSSRFNRIFTLFDFDYSGITLANKYYHTYGIPRIMLTNGKYGFPDYRAKDVAELYELHHSIDVVQEVLENLMTYAEQSTTRASVARVSKKDCSE